MLEQMPKLPMTDREELRQELASDEIAVATRMRFRFAKMERHFRLPRLPSSLQSLDLSIFGTTIQQDETF